MFAKFGINKKSIPVQGDAPCDQHTSHSVYVRFLGYKRAIYLLKSIFNAKANASSRVESGECLIFGLIGLIRFFLGIV